MSGEMEFVYVGRDGFAISTVASSERNDPADDSRGVVLHMTLEDLMHHEAAFKASTLYRFEPKAVSDGFKTHRECRAAFKSYVKGFDRDKVRPEGFYDQVFQLTITGAALKRFRQVEGVKP
jgi:hypothetical protein